MTGCAYCNLNFIAIQFMPQISVSMTSAPYAARFEAVPNS
jgi:hypothetical protein